MKNKTPISAFPLREGLPPRELEIAASGKAINVIVQTLLEKIYEPVTPAELRSKTAQAFAQEKIFNAEGKSLSPEDFLSEGERIYIYQDAPDQGESIPDLEVLWENPVAMIVNKPAGLASMPRGKYVARSILVQARKQFGHADIALAHRLDRGTSGCLLLVKDSRWRGTYQEMFARAEVEKTYQAFTGAHFQKLPGLSWQGSLSELQSSAEYIWRLKLNKVREHLSVQVLAGEIYQKNPVLIEPGLLDKDIKISQLEQTDPEEYRQLCAFKQETETEEPGVKTAADLALATRPLTKKALLTRPQKSRRSQSRLDLLQRMWAKLVATSPRLAEKDQMQAGLKVHEWEIKPESGYLHQIRVSMALLGQQILNDPLYPEALPYGKAWDLPLGLRAISLSFRDPYTKEKITVSAPKMSLSDILAGN